MSETTIYCSTHLHSLSSPLSLLPPLSPPSVFLCPLPMLCFSWFLMNYTSHPHTKSLCTAVGWVTWCKRTSYLHIYIPVGFRGVKSVGWRPCLPFLILFYSGRGWRGEEVVGGGRGGGGFHQRALGKEILSGVVHPHSRVGLLRGCNKEKG